MTDPLIPFMPEALVSELRALIQSTRERVAQTVNSELIWLHWQDCARAACTIELDPLARAHRHRRPAQAAVLHRAVPHRAMEHPHLKDKMDGMLFERTAIAKRPAQVVKQTLSTLREEQRMSPDLVFRDPYILDFLGLPSDFSEAELEAAILRELESFLLELGSGFSFIARQKRISISADDYYLDLLFFHRALRALVAIELKLGRFDARDKGQMELYLRWLDRHERQPGENPPLGLILCADKNEEQIELLELTDGSVRVASYLTELLHLSVAERIQLVEDLWDSVAAHPRRLTSSGLSSRRQIVQALSGQSHDM
jgi:predicted nuclease of restriction endonuclease-like (RecB) superfamily